MIPLLEIEKGTVIELPSPLTTAQGHRLVLQCVDADAGTWEFEAFLEGIFLCSISACYPDPYKDDPIFMGVIPPVDFPELEDAGEPSGEPSGFEVADLIQTASSITNLRFSAELDQDTLSDIWLTDGMHSVPLWDGLNVTAESDLIDHSFDPNSGELYLNLCLIGDLGLSLMLRRDADITHVELAYFDLESENEDVLETLVGEISGGVISWDC